MGCISSLLRQRSWIDCCVCIEGYLPSLQCKHNSTSYHNIVRSWISCCVCIEGYLPNSEHCNGPNWFIISGVHFWPVGKCHNTTGCQGLRNLKMGPFQTPAGVFYCGPFKLSIIEDYASVEDISRSSLKCTKPNLTYQQPSRQQSPSYSIRAHLLHQFDRQYVCQAMKIYEPRTDANDFVTTGLKCATTWFEQFLLEPQTAISIHQYWHWQAWSGQSALFIAGNNGNTDGNGPKWPDVPGARAASPDVSTRAISILYWDFNPIFQTFQFDVSDISIRSPAPNTIWWNEIWSP